jgi:hypothetical protein
MAKADFTRSIITNTIKVAEVKADNGAVITYRKGRHSKAFT